MPAQPHQPSTRPATTRAASPTAQRANGYGWRNHRAAAWPVELSFRATIDLVVEGQDGDSFGIDPRTAS
jgi:hypothetical protein